MGNGCCAAGPENLVGRREGEGEGSWELRGRESRAKAELGLRGGLSYRGHQGKSQLQGAPENGVLPSSSGSAE
jgi:hypothetical protein